MSSVNIMGFTWSFVSPKVKIQFAYEVIFTETEVKLDVGFVPTLILKLSLNPLAKPITNNNELTLRTMLSPPFEPPETVISLPVVQPTGSTQYSKTEYIELAQSAFWKDGSIAQLLGYADTVLSVQLNLIPQIFESRATFNNRSPGQIEMTKTVVATPIDTTDDLKGTITARGGSNENLFDNRSSTKWQDLAGRSWVQYSYAAGISGQLTSYTLTSAGDAPERDPVDWQLLGSNDGGTTWTTVDSRTGVAFSARLQKLTFLVSGTPTYKAYRLNITNVLNPMTAGSIQLAEMELIGQQVTGSMPVTLIDTTDDLKGTITARGEIGSGEGKEKLFDNQTSTKWLDFSPQGSWVQYTYAAGIAGRLTSYTLTSAGDAPERDPADWQLLGSNDGGATWVTVDSRTGVTFSDRLQMLTFTVSGTPTYKAYRLNITKVLNPASANSVQLAEIELLGQQVPG